MPPYRRSASDRYLPLDVLQRITSYVQVHGRPPTRRELAASYGKRDSATFLVPALRVLHHGGYLTIAAHSARNLQPTDHGWQSVAAGHLIHAAGK